MTEKQEHAPQAEKAVPVQVKPALESIYTAEELADSYTLFATSREIVMVALRLTGRKTFTLPEAKRIIETFKNKEVI